MKKSIIITLVILSTFFAYSSTYKLNSNKLDCLDDISIQSINKCNLNLPGKVWLISYAGGNEVHFSNQFNLMQSAINRCVDNIKAYNPTSLDPVFIQKNKKILSLPRGNGYWLWKPYVILDTLKQIPEGDILLYVDSSAKIIKPIDGLLNNLASYNILMFKVVHTNRQYVKRDLLKIMNMDFPEFRDASHLHAGFIALKNNKFTRQFVKEWLELCENERAITDLPSYNEYHDFIDHRHDQAVLSLLYLKYQKKYKEHFNILDDKELLSYFYHHRRRNIHGIKYLTKICSFQNKLNVWKEIFSFFKRP